MSRQGQRIDSPLISARKFRPNTTPANMASSTTSSGSISRRVIRGLDSGTFGQMEILPPSEHNSPSARRRRDLDEDSVTIDEELDTLPPSPEKARFKPAAKPPIAPQISNSTLQSPSPDSSAESHPLHFRKQPANTSSSTDSPMVPVQSDKKATELPLSASPVPNRKNIPSELIESELLKPRPHSATNGNSQPFQTRRPARINLGRKELIGKGSFGIVYRAMDLDTNHLIAVKEVSIAPGSVRAEQLATIRKEIALLEKLDHPNIVRYLGEQWDGLQCLRIFMEYVPGGSISSTLRSFGRLEEHQAARFSQQILSGLAYLHSLKIAHRDLKGDNLLMEVDGRVKLADFGTAKEFATKNEAQTVAGTAFFMAPEVIKGAGHGVEADIWSFGCCVVEMLTGKPPFSTFGNQYAIMMHVADMKEDAFPMPQNLSDKAVQFLGCCMRKDPTKRLSASELLCHPWIRDPPQPSTVPCVSTLCESQIVTAKSVAPSPHCKSGIVGGDTYKGLGDSFNPMNGIIEDE